MNFDIDQLSAWEGRTEARTDLVTATPASAMAAVMDRDRLDFRVGDPLPPGWHWLYFLPLARQSEIGPDGHPRRGGFLPPVPLPRRMWASGSMRIHDPLRIGDTVARTSRVESVQFKEGRSSGPMVIVTLVHDSSTERGPSISETQVLVYRGEETSPSAASGTPAAMDETWRMDVVPDPVLLFRYSALTFNGHRIHYDRDYASGIEHYPGLVVQGPLVSSLLLELLHRNIPGKRVAQFRFRALRPLYDTHPFSVCARMAAEDGDTVLWARDAQGMVTMEASASLV
jgi:3-methylfumaryl-CoA hydratase